MSSHFVTPLISVTQKYSLLRGGVYYFYRKVPLQFRQEHGQFVRECLHTADPLLAAKLIARKNREAEQRWQRGASDQPSTQDKAIGLLAQRGLAPLAAAQPFPEDFTDEQAAVDLFIDTLDRKREAHARGVEEIYDNAALSEYLPPVEVEALRLLTEPPRFLLSDAVKLYLAGHRKRDNEDFTGDVGRNWKCLIDIVGDKPFADLSRADARTFIDKRCADGLKTGSVRRQLKSIAAVVSMVLREREMEKVSPFIRLDIPNEHLDVVQRDILSPDQLRTLADACKAKDDDMRWAIALQMDLGSRIAEVVGLALADLHVDAEIPYVDIKPHPWRTLKNKGAVRPVPLVGLALWAARRIKATAVPQQVYAFPRYIDDTGTRAKCKAVGASSTFNKWMRGMGIDRTTHCFRHTMRDRLREVEAPHDIQHAIGGWGKQDQGDKYGRGYKLDVLLPWLNKVVVVV